MSKYLFALIVFMFLVTGVQAQSLLGPAPTGPPPTPPVVPPSGTLIMAASAGMQLSSTLGFIMQVNGEGPYPVVGVSLIINGKTVEGLVTYTVKVVDPLRNYTTFAMAKKPGIIIKAGDAVKVIVVDSNGNTASRSTVVVPGFANMLAFFVVY